MSKSIKISPVSECAILVRFHNSDPNTLKIIGHTTDSLYQQFHHYIMNITPSVDTILIDYLPHRISMNKLKTLIEQTIDAIDQESLNTLNNKAIRLPVYYAPEVGPDIVCYQDKGIALEQLIHLHTSAIYTVAAIGFAPGFAFMQHVSPEISLPRLATPRISVPKGSVAIADNRTAVYPDDSPGGWNVIGNCPLDLYQPNQDPMIPFKVGCQVQFYSIDIKEFMALGGRINGAFL